MAQTIMTKDTRRVLWLMAIVALASLLMWVGFLFSLLATYLRIR